MVTESNFEEKKAGRKEMIKALWSYTQWSNTYELKGNRHFYLPGPWMSLSQQDWKLTESMEDNAVIGGCFETEEVVRPHWTTFVSKKLIQNLYLLRLCPEVISRVSRFASLSYWCTVCIWSVLEKQFSLFRSFIKWKIPLENLWDCSYGNQIRVSQSVKSDSNLLIGLEHQLVLLARLIPGTDRLEQEETRKERQLRRLEPYNWFIDSELSISDVDQELWITLLLL